MTSRLGELALRIALSFLAPLPKWPCNSKFSRPPFANSPRVRRPRNAVASGFVPPQFAVRGALNETAVCGLDSSAGPHAIARLIIAVNIHALYRKIVSVTGRFRPSLKGGEVIPFGAYGYAAPAVVFKLRPIRIVASLPHTLPSMIKAATGPAMLALHIAEPVGVNRASARRRFPGSKISRDYHPLGSAVAFACPKRPAAARIASLFHYHPFAKSPTGQIDQPRVLCHRCAPSNYSEAYHNRCKTRNAPDIKKGIPTCLA